MTWIRTRILTYSLNHQWMLSGITILISTDDFLIPMSTLFIKLLHLPIYHTNTGQKPNGIRSINPVLSSKILSKPAHWISISGAEIVEIIQRSGKDDKPEWSMMALFLLEKFGIWRETAIRSSEPQNMALRSKNSGLSHIMWLVVCVCVCVWHCRMRWRSGPTFTTGTWWSTQTP